MPVDVWGQLAKAQDDATTIDEAVAAAIAEHEADATSHLGADESLQSHRASEIIDHAVGSVLADKFTNREFVLNLPFESLDKYDKSGAGIDYDIGGYRLDTSSTINTERELNAIAQYSGDYFNYDRDCTFQFYGILSSTSDVLAYVMAGGNGILTDPPGVGFKLSGASLYAVESVWGGAGFEEYTSAITGITTTSKHIYRVQVDATVGEAYFWVDGVAKATLTLHTSEDVGLVLFSSYLKNTASAQKQLRISGVYFANNPL